MGGGVSKALGFRKPEVMSVDPELEIDKRIHTFSRTMFKKMEWEVMKAFCQKYKIKQHQLIIVFQRYLTHDEVYIREFKVRTKDPKLLYLRETKLQQELAEIMLPSIYMKPFAGLETMDSADEVSFARFVVMSYIFGLQQFPDLLFDFFAIVRRKLSLQLSVTFGSYSIQQTCLLLVEDLKSSGGASLINTALKNLDNAPDFRLRTLIRFGTKYPLLFWALQKFRKCYKRFVFGDRFWLNRKHMKLKCIDLLDFPTDYNEWFLNEDTAVKFTAIHIISDVIISTSNQWTFSDIYNPPLSVITSEQITKLKEVVGYKVATRLLIESQIPYDFEPIFAAPFIYKERTDDVPETSKQDDLNHPSSEESEIINEEPATDAIDDSGGDEIAMEEENDENIEVIEGKSVEDGEEGDEYIQQENLGVILHDDGCDREFAYDVKTGRSRWAKIIMNESGRTLLYKFE